MANYTELKTAVSAVIKTNNNQEITGQLLQNVLNNIISVIGANATFAGIATPDTAPGTPDQNVFYLASEPGVYANFANISVNMGELAVLKWNGAWSKQTIKVGLPPNELNISTLYPTSGIDGTNRYTLEGAVAQVPTELRNVGLKVSFVDSAGQVETWEYQGGTFDTKGSWEQTPTQDHLLKLKDMLENAVSYSFIKGSTLNEETARKGDIIYTQIGGVWRFVFKAGDNDNYWVINQIPVVKGDVVVIQSIAETDLNGINPSLALYFSDKEETAPDYSYQRIAKNITSSYSYNVENDGYIAATMITTRVGQEMKIRIKKVSELKSEIDSIKTGFEDFKQATNEDFKAVNKDIEDINSILSELVEKESYSFIKGSTLNEETARKGTMSLVVGESGNYYVFKEGTSDVYWVTNQLKVKKGDVIDLQSSAGTAGGNNPSIIFFFTDDVNKGFQKIEENITTNYQYAAYSDGYIVLAITIVRVGQIVTVNIKRASDKSNIKDYMLDLSVINPGSLSNSNLDTKNYYQIGNNVYLENNNAVLQRATKVAALIGLTSADLGRLPDRLYLYADYYSIRASCKLINGDNEYILSFNNDLNCYEINLSELDKSKDLFITLEATTNVSTDKILSIENIHLLPNPYNGEAFVKPYELEGVFGKNSYILTPDTTKNLQDVIDEIAIGGTLYITEGDYILPAESLKIKRPITIKGIGNVRFLGGKYIKDAMAVEGYDDVYSAQVNSDDTGYVYGKIWQDNIPSETISDDGWDIYNNRTHRLPSTLLKNVLSVDAVKTSDEPCYFVDGSTMYFRTVPGSDLNQNPIVINRYNSSNYYPDNKDKLEVDFNAKDVNIDNIAVYYSMLAIRKSDSINITNTKVFFSNSQMCLAIAQQAMANIVFKNCEFAGGNGDGMHSNYHGIPINGLVDVRFYSCWFHDCNDGVSSHSGANKPELRFYDCLFSHNSITGSAPVNAKELYVNCIFKKNGSARGGLRIVSVDGECDVTCINCMSIDNEGDAWSVQTDSAKATLNLYGCKSILTDNSAGIGFVYQKTQNKAGYINAYGCSNNYPAEKQSKITGEGKINIVGEMLIAMTPQTWVN